MLENQASKLFQPPNVPAASEFLQVQGRHLATVLLMGLDHGLGQGLGQGLGWHLTIRNFLFVIALGPWIRPTCSGVLA